MHTDHFKQRLLRREPLLGSFVKTPSVHPIEVLGGAGFDFVVIDEEHAPFDRTSIDLALLAAKASGIAALVRVASVTPAKVLAALDDGAAGILAPHISTAAQAQALVDAARYSGQRGYSNSPRAGGYGAASLWPLVDASDAAVVLIAMIEDQQGVDNIHAILAVDGIDAVFVGRGDLAVATADREPGAPRTHAATETVIAAARAAGKPVCLFVSGADEAQAFIALGATAFIVSSDQGLMRTAALHAVDAFEDWRQLKAAGLRASAVAAVAAPTAAQDPARTLPSNDCGP